MSTIAHVMRPFWAQGLKDISNPAKGGLSSWFSSGEYQIYTLPQSAEFVLCFTHSDEILAYHASDCKRMAIAAFESASAITRNAIFPRASGWQIIQTYYAAFFAAHAILRFFGTSCTQVDTLASRSIARIASLFLSNSTAPAIERGQYICNVSNGAIVCRKCAGNAGVHESFWQTFVDSMKSINADILNAALFPQWDQTVSVKLSELCDILTTGTCSNGAWLSQLRNRVNYRHELSTWFPYEQYHNHNTKFVDDGRDWWSDPMSIALFLPEQNELQRFHAACQFILALCRVVTIDMNTRTSARASFLNNGPMQVLRRMSAPC